MSIEYTIEATGKTQEKARDNLRIKVEDANDLLKNKHIKTLPDSPGADNEFYRIEYQGGNEDIDFSGEARGESYDSAYHQTELACPGLDIEVKKVHVRFTYELDRRQNRVLRASETKKKPKKQSKGTPAAPMFKSNQHEIYKSLDKRVL